jgi:hypothetical protein
MKTYITFICAFILFTASSITGQVPNGSFELWTSNSLGRPDLQNWETSNLLYDRASTLQEVGRLGIGYSAKLISVYDSSVGYYEGGLAHLTEFPFSGSTRPSTVLGYWKTLNPGFDAAVFAEVFLYDSSLVEIGYGGIQTPFGLSLPNWTNFSIPISYTTGDPVSFYTLTFTWYNFGVDSTAHAFIDDVSFDVSTNLNAINRRHEISVSTLSNGVYILRGSENFTGNFDVQIYDITGKRVSSQSGKEQTNPTQDLNVDISSQAAGIYLCKIVSVDRVSSVRLLKY